jgi:alpha-mannosidase
MKSYMIFALLIIAVSATYSQDADEQLKKLLDLVNETRNYREGFAKSIGANDFIYHSIRTDINECLITRATDGQMAIEWLTSTIEENIVNEGSGFLWMAAMDIVSTPYTFDFYLNDKKRFTIRSGNSADWSIESAEGGVLSFYNKENDHHGDAHGYMALWAPGSWLVPGVPQRIKIVGEAAGSNTWLIVYKAQDAAEYLKRSVEFDKWLNLKAVKEGRNYKVTIVAPGYFAGEKLSFSVSNNKGTFITERDDLNAVGHFEISEKAIGKPLIIKDANGEIVSVKSFGKTGSTSKLLSEAIMKNEQTVDGDKRIMIRAQRIYSPKTVKSLNLLANSKLSDGSIYLMNSSHQDIAWMDSPEKCVLERDTMLLSPLFELASRNLNYRFDIEDALMLKEYIHRHPDKTPLVRQMLSDGRISCGSTYIQPYEEMYSGESLARQFYFGAKWLKDEFDYSANVYWNVDVPGRTLQMPQIMKKAGTDFLMMSRFEKGIYKWYSPDGSYITAFSPGHYADAFRPLQKNFYDAAQFLSHDALYWEKYYQVRSSETVIPLLSDWDMSPAVDYSPFINQWKHITELQNEKGEFVTVSLPEFNIASGPEFFKAITAGIRELPSLKGERPAIWLYIHGPSHQRALKASREGDIVLTQAEKFATANAWLEGSYKKYPQEELNMAWEAKIYPDHGWGGKNGEITDHLFLQKFLYALNEGEEILDRTLRDISSKVKTDPEKGVPVIVYNSLNWSRTDVVSAKLYFDEGEAYHLLLKNALGNEIPVQITEKKTFPDGSLKSAVICFIADGVPSIGFKTYYYTPSPRQQSMPTRNVQNFENKFYRIEFADGGLSSIYDKQLQKELIDPSKFKAGEVFTMRSAGNGAGEFASVQQPDMEGFDKTGNYKTQWELKQNGPVYVSFKMRQPVKHAVVEQEVIVYHNLKRIDFRTDILNWEGILFREYRFALPLNMKDGQVVYEVPYGVLEVGKDEIEGYAGERYKVPCRDTRPRGIQNWIGAYNKDYCVILSSSVVVADYIDPTDNSMYNQFLQPILFASRQSCHGEGNDYLQTGNHSFRFSLTSTQPDWRNGYKAGLQANEVLRVVVAPEQYQNVTLPEEQSFFTVDASNVIISTIKKSEDDHSAVIRMFEIEGRETETTLNAYKKIGQLQHANLIEEPLEETDVSGGRTIKIGHHAIETYLMR